MDLDDLIAPTTPAKVTVLDGRMTIDDLDGMQVEDLLALRSEIDARLPATSLRDIDLAEELVLQFQKVKALQSKVLDSGTSAQQKAAVANSCASALGQLVKMQTELYTAERMKAIEQIVIHVMRDQPEHIQVAFFDKYERALGEGV